MGRRAWSLIAIALGLGVLLSQWGAVTDRFGHGGGRPKHVNLWSASGTPEVELRQVRDFMAAHPEISVSHHFAQSGALTDVVFVSFLSGNPPDVLSIKRKDVREMVAEGMIRPLDDLIARQRREDPRPLEDSLAGEYQFVRFRCDPNDRFIRERDRYPKQAARLIGMHGKVIGLGPPGFAPTLTYNRRLFAEAARRFPDAGLLDAQGQPRPPATWSQLLHVTRTISEHGRLQAAEDRAAGRPERRCYGLVIQGQFPDDLARRTLLPLVNRAGGHLFDFAGGDLGDGTVAGRFAYDHPAYLGAFRLLLELHAGDCVLPGTTSREYEQVRAEVGAGNAAMLIDGWHAAMIAGQRIPWAREHIGSAPVPVPDPEITARYGLPLRPGRVQRDGVEVFQVITAATADPWPVWQWLMFGMSAEAQRASYRRGILPTSRSGLARLDDPEWFPLPYQKPAMEAILAASALWPTAPTHGTILDPTPFAEVLYSALAEAQAVRRDPAAVVDECRPKLAGFAAAANRDLAKRIRAGDADAAAFTFPAFDPADPEAALREQRRRADSPAVDATVADLRAQLPDHLRDLVGQRFRPVNSPLKALFVPGMLLAAVAAFAFATAWRNRRLPPAQRVTAATLRRAWHSYVFVAPTLVMLCALIFFPALYLAWLSLHQGKGITEPEWVGLANYARVFTDSVFWSRVLPNTAFYMVVVTGVQVGVGLLLACLLNVRLRGIGVYRLLFFVPMVTSLSVVSVIFFGLLSGADSALNQLLAGVGLGDLPSWLGLVTPDAQGQVPKMDWLGHPATGRWCVAAVAIWQGLPFTIILLLAGLQSVPVELYEAAKIDGANAPQRFRHITIPALLPILIVILFNSLIGAAQIMGVIFVLTRGGAGSSSDSVATYLFKRGFQDPPESDPDLGYACAIGMVYAAMLAALTALNVRFIARKVRGRDGAAAPATDATGGAHG